MTYRLKPAQLAAIRKEFAKGERYDRIVQQEGAVFAHEWVIFGQELNDTETGVFLLLKPDEGKRVIMRITKQSWKQMVKEAASAFQADDIMHHVSKWPKSRLTLDALAKPIDTPPTPY